MKVVFEKKKLVLFKKKNVYKFIQIKASQSFHFLFMA